MHRNMKNLKLKYIVLLMLISQILLILFVIIWLRGQYKDEKIQLRFELNHGLLEAGNKAVDSILSDRFIKPILGKDSAFVEFVTSSPKIQLDSIYTFSGVDSISLSDSNKGLSMIKVQISDTVQHDSVSGSFYKRKISENYQDIISRGMTLFVNKIVGVGERSRDSIKLINVDRDTGLIKRNFVSFLKTNNYNFNIKWNDRNLSEEEFKKGIHIKVLYVGGPVGAEIEKFDFYLIKNILDRILFAFALIIITSLAFRISYLNLKKQRKLLTLKNDFISNISHELKTPVATVKVALEALNDFNKINDPALVKDYLSMSLKEMSRLEMLVTKVMNNSMLESGQDIFNMEKDNLIEIINESIESQLFRFERNGHEIQFETKLESAIVNADRIHLIGVLINIIDNGLKYGAENVTFKIFLEELENNYLIRLQDNGPGIPDEYLNKIFEKFFRVPGYDKHNVKGYGLGLNYALQVMQKHGGDIDVVNISSGGCEFKLLIPKA